MAGQTAQYKISRSAAERDIQNISKAKEKLTEAAASINKLKSIAQATHGMTGQAIVDQCDKLQKKVTDLQSNLVTSQALINSVVQRYEEEDKRLKAEIMKNAVGR